MITSNTLESIKAVDIDTIANDLGITTRNRMCRCPFHDDHHPSMKLYASPSPHAHCFVCGKSWDGIAMVMDILHISFTEACQWIADRNGIWTGDGWQRFNVSKPTHRVRHNIITPKQTTKKDMEILSLPTEYVTSRQSTDNTFCRSLVSNGILSQAQMEHAAQRYRLGTAQDGGVIFWQIDEEQRVRDGKIMHYNDDCHRNHKRDPGWVSNLLSRNGQLPAGYHSEKCLFGLHSLGDQVSDNAIVAVVESEKTAVICSERFPSLPVANRSDDESKETADASLNAPVIWLATGGLSCLSVARLMPLCNYRVIIFPDTDPEGATYKAWAKIAHDASKQFGHHVSISDLLERCATTEQKLRKIDIADYIIEIPY